MGCRRARGVARGRLRPRAPLRPTRAVRARRRRPLRWRADATAGVQRARRGRGRHCSFRPAASWSLRLRVRNAAVTIPNRTKICARITPRLYLAGRRARWRYAGSRARPTRIATSARTGERPQQYRGRQPPRDRGPGRAQRSRNVVAELAHRQSDSHRAAQLKCSGIRSVPTR
jgi:hypothetical protein